MGNLKIKQLKRVRLSYRNKISRILWGITWALLFRPSPVAFYFWRRFLLRLFGAKVGKQAEPYPSCRIWAPWNLIMEEGSGIGPEANIYNVDQVILKKKSDISQYAYLCTATHDYNSIDFDLLIAPIIVEERAWVAAGAYIQYGVTIGKGAVIGAKSVVVKSVEAWSIVAGNPAKVIGYRKLSELKNASDS